MEAQLAAGKISQTAAQLREEESETDVHVCVIIQRFSWLAS